MTLTRRAQGGAEPAIRLRRRAADGTPGGWRVTSLALALTMAVALLLGLPARPAAAAPAAEPTLWLTDDVMSRVYNITLDGTVLTSFLSPGVPRAPRADSSIAVDPVDRTLWGANDGQNGGLVNYTRDGQVLQEIPAADFGGVRTEGLDVTVSTDNVTLWVVDDPLGGSAVPTVYNLTRTGELLSSFPTSMFDPASTSPQAIAYDPYTSSLWMTDNASDKVYNISQDGDLLSSISVNTPAFGGIENVQGLTVESSEVLWITARDTGRIYRITKTGDQVLSSFPISDVDPAAADPTGVAFDRPPGYVGAAAPFAVFGLAGAELKLKDADKSTGVVGDVGLGADATQSFDDGLLTGALVVDPAANNANANSVAISGGVEPRVLALPASDAEFSSVAASILAPTQVLGEVKDSASIVATDDVNVVDAVKIDLDNGETLTLVGDASSSFVINLAEKFKLNHSSSIALEGGVSARNVFFNVLGFEDVSIENGSFAVGTIVAPDAKMKIKGKGSALSGSMIGGREIKLEDGGRLRALSAALEPGDVGAAATTTVLGLPGSKVRIADQGSTVVGDVALGPFSVQEFDEGLIDGSLLVDPFADNDRDNEVEITGGTVGQQVSQAAADAIDAAYGAARLPADQVFGDIKASSTIVGGDGLTVVSAKKIELDGAETLTISGGPSSRFVFNLAEKLALKQASAVALSGGVLPEHVIFNVVSDKDSSVESGSAASGTILSPLGKVKVKDAGSTLSGSAISGNEVVIEKAGEIRRPE